MAVCIASGLPFFVSSRRTHFSPRASDFASASAAGGAAKPQAAGEPVARTGASSQLQEARRRRRAKRGIVMANAAGAWGELLAESLAGASWKYMPEGFSRSNG